MPDAVTTAAGGADRPLSPRERFRLRTREEIKEAARRQMAEACGAGSLSLNALAKSMGMAGPSLYRYFGSRDELLTELLVDAFDDLADAVEGAVRDGDAPPVEALRRYAGAYRDWALAHPELYELLFGTPVPGYAAPAGSTEGAAARSMAVVVRLVERLGPPADAPPVRPSPAWAGVLASLPASPASLAAAVALFARVHGLVSLELRGHVRAIVDDPAALFDAEVRRALRDLAS